MFRRDADHRRVADDGVCFDRTYLSAPTCTPSRAGLVTGRYPHDAGAWTNNLRLHQGVETMGQHFQRAGYRTAWVGKWHLDGEYFGHGVAPPGYGEAYAAGDVFMDSIRDAGKGGIYRPLYFGCVEVVDSEIGRVLESVDSGESVVGFTSDHGHYPGAHVLDLKHLAMYDEVTNVPLILRGPGVAEGERTDALVSLTDLLPTFLDVADAEIPEELHGQSFWDVARDPSATTARRH